LLSHASAAIKAVVFQITDKITSQISLSINNLAAGVSSTKEFLDTVARQQAETTVKLQESILSNAESSKSIADVAEKLLDTSTRQSQGTSSEWPMLPNASSMPVNAIHPASLMHTTFLAP
jgi:hypothetical protein